MIEWKPFDKDRPDGWVVWHPEQGIMSLGISKLGCEERLIGVKY